MLDILTPRITTWYYLCTVAPRYSRNTRVQASNSYNVRVRNEPAPVFIIACLANVSDIILVVDTFVYATKCLELYRGNRSATEDSHGNEMIVKRVQDKYSQRFRH